jgi:hypothetical protein
MAGGIVLTAFFILDFAAWVATGEGLAEQIGGSQPALIGAIAHHIAGMPWWLFWPLLALCVVILSALIALAVVSMYKKEMTE